MKLRVFKECKSKVMKCQRSPEEKKEDLKKPVGQIDKMSSGDGWFRKGQLEFIIKIGST